MSNTRRAVRVLAGGGALGLAGALTLGWGPLGRPEASEPRWHLRRDQLRHSVRHLSRVPVETAGGSSTPVLGTLGKSLSQAAGFTLGDLGDTFRGDLGAANTITAMPSVINCAGPPSTTAPREAHLSAWSVRQARQRPRCANADLAARASGRPDGHRPGRG